MLESKDYYIDLINSSKAYKFTSLYHYSGIGFKKAKINQGIYRKTDNRLVGVLQWGCSAQEGIRLDRYVTNDITKEEYLELNRFCMADSEPKNSESQALSLGMKWIKQNRKDIRLLVSYAGRIEGNYGTIYQATNWEYLGYFISNGFWLLDGEERHQITVWYRYQKFADTKKSLKEGICELYHDVRRYSSKQFIYIQRLDKSLNCASPILAYPKESTDFPIVTEQKIYKQDDNYLNIKKDRTYVEYYYEKENRLFSLQALKRKGDIGSFKPKVAIYDRTGQLIEVIDSIVDISKEYDDCNDSGVRAALKSEKVYKNKFFRYINYFEATPEYIDIPYVCEIDGIRFLKQVEVATYCEVTRQAVSKAMQIQSKTIGGRQVVWNNNK